MEVRLCCNIYMEKILIAIASPTTRPSKTRTTSCENTS